MSKLISQVLLIFLNQEWIGVSKCVPVSRPLGYLWFGGSFFPLGHTKEGDYIFFFSAFSSLFSFSCFPVFLTMWRHCKSSAAKLSSSSGAVVLCTLPLGTVFAGHAAGCSCILKPGRGWGQATSCHLVGQVWEPARACDEQYSRVVVTLFLFFSFKSRDACVYRKCTYFGTFLVLKSQTVFQRGFA